MVIDILSPPMVYTSKAKSHLKRSIKKKTDNVISFVINDLSASIEIYSCLVYWIFYHNFLLIAHVCDFSLYYLFVSISTTIATKDKHHIKYKIYFIDGLLTICIKFVADLDFKAYHGENILIFKFIYRMDRLIS